ncbi:MAG: fimbrial protein, partial [Pseudomonas sp.]
MYKLTEEQVAGGGAIGCRSGADPRRIMFWFGLAVLATLGLSSRAALAQSVDCSGTDETIPITMPASITVPRDAANGSILSAWVSTAATSNYYRCTVVRGGGIGPATGMGFQAGGMTKTGMSVIGPTGVSYTVWNTSLPGVGVAIGVRPYLNSCGWQGWVDLGTRRPFFPDPWTGQVCSGSGNVINGGQVQMALVKTGAITPGSVAGVQVEGAVMSGNSVASGYTADPAGRKLFTLLSNTVLNLAACSTPHVKVNLGSHKQSIFKGVGSTTPAVAFNVDVSACPAGLNSIQYQFSALNGVLNSANGVLDLSPDSTATGIGVQLPDGGGAALKFDT